MKINSKATREDLIDNPMNEFIEVMSKCLSEIFAQYYFGPETGFKAKYKIPDLSFGVLYILSRGPGILNLFFSFD